MKGTEEYNLTMEKKAKKIIEDNPDKPYLEGFYYYALSNMSYASAFNYLFYVYRFIKESDIKDVSKITMDTYTKYMYKTKNYTSSYRIAIYSSLKKFSVYLKANNYCENYMQFIPRPKFYETQQTKEKREIGYLTKSETKELLSSVPTKNKTRNRSNLWQTRDKAIILLFLNTGIRCAALYKLDIDDIDINQKTIRVLEKGEKARCININDVTMNTLLEWITFRNKYMCNCGVKDEPALFISQRKERLGTYGIAKVIRDCSTSIENKHITPHKLRATYGTQLYNATHDIYFVQSCMGHSSPIVTEKYIRGVKNDATKIASDLMSEFLD